MSNVFQQMDWTSELSWLNDIMQLSMWRAAWLHFAADVNRLRLLGISFFQKSAPELVLSERFGENQLVVAGGDAVVHNHIDPFTVTPELSIRRRI